MWEESPLDQRSSALLELALEQDSKQSSSMVSASGSCPDFLSDGVWPGAVSWNKPFPPHVTFGHGVNLSSGKQTDTKDKLQRPNA